MKTNSVVRILLLFCAVSLVASFAYCAAPKNIIICIGDGMGPEQVKAAGMYVNGSSGTLFFESFTNKGNATTYSADSSITDSAAAGTAIATGHKVNNGVISLAIPGNSSELYTLLEYYKDRGKSAGLITTDAMVGATPAAFGAHETSRNNTSQIADDFLNQTRPNVLFGGGSSGITLSSAQGAGYAFVSDRASMAALNTETATNVAGQFGSGSLPYEYDGVGSLPHLSEMAKVALAILDNDTDGLFLMMEGGNIDHAGHINDLPRNIFETIEFSSAVKAVFDWAQGRTDTLIIVTADHETGGLQVTANNGKGNLPTVTWSTTGHSGANAPVYAWGVNAALISGTINNTDFFAIVTTGTVDTTPPNAPAAVRDGATAGTDISSTTSKTQLSANWTASTDNESGIGGYQYAIGTTAGSTNITNWTALGNVLTVTKTGLSLTVGTTYYFSVKAVNGAGLTGSAANSNGQVVISTAVPDTTAPSAPGTVSDGATAGTDTSFTYSTVTLSANWTAATDSESGIFRYDYSIGTSPGGTNVVGWTALGNVLTATKTGLTLTIGTTYYFSVKAINGAGLSGPTANSNGQYVNQINTADTTPPSSIAQVRDGNEPGIDAAVTYLTDGLSANWTDSADAESGISSYLYAIGTAPGATDITNWKDNGVLTEVTETGLTLTSGTTYYFSVKAENGVSMRSAPANSDGQYVTSAVVQGPVISNVQAANITANSVTITWDTDKPATGQVEYGITAAYGSQTTEDGSLVTAHSVTITGLIAGRGYHYRVISKDGDDGNQSTSPDHTFTTLAAPVAVTEVNAYPNPCDFSNGQVIKFKVGAGSETGEVKIYTISGKLVKKLAGTGAAEWNGTNDNGEKVARGIYIYKIIESDDTITGKIGVLK